MENGKDVWALILKKLDKLEQDVDTLMNPLYKDYITHKQLMEFTKRSDGTIRRWRDSGKIGFSRLGDETYIYKRKDVDKFFDAGYNRPLD